MRYGQIFLLCMLMIGVGCSVQTFTQGEDFSVPRALHITDGMSDRNVIETMQSAPYDRIEHDENNETWVWVYSENKQTKTFTVTLQNKRVITSDLRFSED